MHCGLGLQLVVKIITFVRHTHLQETRNLTCQNRKSDCGDAIVKCFLHRWPTSLGNESLDFRMTCANQRDPEISIDWNYDLKTFYYPKFFAG